MLTVSKVLTIIFLLLVSASAATAEIPSQLEDTLSLSPAETAIIEDTIDGNSQLDEPGLSLVLGKTVKLPHLSIEDLPKLDTPSYHNLLRNPQRYRCQPMSIHLRAFSITKMRLSDFTSLSSTIPLDTAVWRIFATTASGGQEEPVFVLSLVDPQLPKPDKVEPDAEQLYNKGPEIRVACVFYKIYKTKDRGTAKQPPQFRDYPLLMTWQIYPATAGESFQIEKSFILTAVILVLLVVGFVILKIWIARLKKQTQAKTQQYKSLREDTPKADEPVELDPLLKAAGEDYLKSLKSKECEDEQK